MVLSKTSYLKLWPQQLEKQELTWVSAMTHQNKNNFFFTVQILHFVNRETTFPKGKGWRSIKQIFKILGLPQRKELRMYVKKEQIDQDYKREVLANIIISNKSFFTRCLHRLTIWSQRSQVSRQTMKACVLVVRFLITWLNSLHSSMQQSHKQLQRDYQGLEQGKRWHRHISPRCTVQNRQQWLEASQLPGGTLTEAKSKIKGKLKAPQPRGWQEGEDELRYVMFWENA